MESIDTVTFKTEFGERIFREKYASNQYETWSDKAHAIVNSVCGNADGTEEPLLEPPELLAITRMIEEFKIMPAGRYIWYASRKARYYNNCYLLKAEADTREEWADLWSRAGSCLLTGGGIGVDVSAFRPSGRPLSRTGGVSSGPLPWLEAANAIGREVMQGGSRRSALYGSLNWQHEDIEDFIKMKNWHNMVIDGAFTENGKPFTVADAKAANFNYKAPLDQMNISVNYDDDWLKNQDSSIFTQNVRQAMETGEPGFSFNFGDKSNETLRNACSEATSEDDSDVCNLASVNLAAVDSVGEFKKAVNLAARFLVCGLIRAHLPYKKVEKVRKRNNRLGVGLMGVHEWLINRGYNYEMVDELKQWMKVYESESERSANVSCKKFRLLNPKGYRAIAPTGSISILAGTTSGLEPIYSVAYRRRYLTGGDRWKYEYVIEPLAYRLYESGWSIKKIDKILTAHKITDPEIRIKFQYEAQKFVDQGISSTVNLTEFGSETNNESLVPEFERKIKKYVRGLRGLTFYPDKSRSGQPLTPCTFEEAMKHRNVVFEDNSEDQCRSGVCGL